MCQLGLLMPLQQGVRQQRQVAGSWLPGCVLRRRVAVRAPAQPPPAQHVLGTGLNALGPGMRPPHLPAGSACLLLATHLARVLAEGGTQPSSARGFVIVETNFR